ncbi:6-pyruvoyl tetrahydropterin synthase family protein [Phenylobacterium sp.]|uniref:6-pyruvoyl trahydropterin synthase family protein n=1 Tax=Phenylobacterium sp. TaxID=1871053 RepID=UPI003567BA90
MYELTKQFRFDAAHTLLRDVEADGSRRIHGHSYRAEVTLRGAPDPASGMIIDTRILADKLEETRCALDHRFLDEINDLGPGTMENLCSFIWRRLEPDIPSLHSVTVLRDSTADRVTYYGESPA